MTRFNHLNVPHQWETYWSKYPNGYTILEALIQWVQQVDNMVDNQNRLNGTVEDYRKEMDLTYSNFRTELSDFIEAFNPNLQAKVIAVLSDWQDSGFLEVIISEALQTQIDEVDERLGQSIERTRTISANVKDLGAVGDGVANDTAAIQEVIDNYLTVDLAGGVYLVDELQVRNKTTLFNGTLKGNSSRVIYGENVSDVTIDKITVDGNGSAFQGILLSASNHDSPSINNVIQNSRVHDLHTENGQSYGIQLRRCYFTTIRNTRVDNITSKPNDVIGDSVGSARGVIINHSKYVLLDNIQVHNVYSADDADGVHFLDQDDIGFTHCVLKNSEILDCESRMIKIQQEGVVIERNRLETTPAYTLDTMRVAAIQVMVNDTKLLHNIIDTIAHVPVGIGTAEATITNCDVLYNTIYRRTGEYQGCINFVSGAFVENVQIAHNRLTGNTLDSEDYAIRLETAFHNISVTNNIVTDIDYIIDMRDLSTPPPSSYTASKKLTIKDNTGTVKTGVMRQSSGSEIINALYIIDNNLEYDALYQNNTVRLNDSQYDSITILNNITTKGVIDGIRRIGFTSQRPTNGLYIGFEYFDRETALMKPVFWNGSNWVDSTGTAV